MRYKKIAAVVGTAAAGLMVVLPLATHGLQGATGNAPGSGVTYGAFTPPPTMNEGATETTTVPPTAPETEKATPLVKAPHK